MGVEIGEIVISEISWKHLLPVGYITAINLLIRILKCMGLTFSMVDLHLSEFLIYIFTFVVDIKKTVIKH